MKLYDAPIAPNPRRVRWVLAEKGVSDIEIVRMNLAEGTHKSPDYMAKAGLANVPALEMDDGTCITESIAICRYLESRYPDPNLFGASPEETAVVEMWMRRAEMLVAVPFMVGVRHTHPAMAALETQDANVGAYNTAQGLAALKVLDLRLAQAEWLAAERLTIADIVAFVGIDFTRLIKLAIPETLTHVHRWAQAMRARPAAQA
ncbi:glutathione S-transferase family protein [Phenylobacterium sp.]|uniref:glutathione S-transferase family protein n=1 Tax=Phenylobacterium sp. TaxID=1871053 RepID=UPI00286C8B04|nr:glutathione S-transferase family protein [Phenylobacterium sp.]